MVMAVRRSTAGHEVKLIMAEPENTIPNLLTIKQFAEKYHWTTEKSLRWIRFRCETNGFRSAFVAIGRKIYLDEVEFFRCVKRLNERGVMEEAGR